MGFEESLLRGINLVVMASKTAREKVQTEEGRSREIHEEILTCRSQEEITGGEARREQNSGWGKVRGELSWKDRVGQQVANTE